MAIIAGPFTLPRQTYAFCRTTTDPIPENFPVLTQCYTGGLPLFWRNACVGYSINRSVTSNMTLDTATTIIDKAFATWSNTTCPASGDKVGITADDLGPVDCDEVNFNPNGPNQNVIIFRDSWPYNDPYNTLGLTTVTFNVNTGEIVDADMELNATGAKLTTTDSVPSTGYDLQSIVTHEAGHFFGLAHSTNPDATMYPAYTPGTSSLRELTSDDIAGICSIYPDVTERTVDTSVIASGILAAGPCDPTPKHGFTSSCDAASPSESSKGCSVGATSSNSQSSGFALGLVLASVAAAIRRRMGQTRGSAPTTNQNAYS
ncbi:MAG: matrixin family metalloprotease [Polyangiaceae bacterium]|nr:matrixin family metalloprotease [Polyangiaceae bacterium]